MSQWKVVQKYTGLLGKSLHPKSEIELGDIIPHLTRLHQDISQDKIDSILKKIGIKYESSPITKIIIESDLKLKKTFLKTQ